MGSEIIVDDVKQGQPTEEVEPSELDELGQEQAEEVTSYEDNNTDSQPVEEVDEDSLLPTRFKGKTRTDIAKSYSELEKVLGRQSTELGELRKLAEERLKKGLGESDDDSQYRVEYEDLLEDPNQAIDKRVNTKVKSFEDKLSQIEQNTARREIRKLHNDVESIIPNPEFQQWVLSDPYRVELFRQANEQFNIDSADTILTEWKEYSGALKATKEADKAKRDKALKAASTETSSTGQSSKKVYRRSDLVRLRIEDPEKFQNLQPEIIKAYSEGRVR